MFCDTYDINICFLCQVRKQTHRNNNPATTAKEYFYPIVKLFYFIDK